MEQINNENFEELVVNSPLPALVVFKASWCGPCQVLSPVIDEIIADYKDKAVVVKIDVDENAEIAIKYAIRSIPALLFLKDGEVVDRIVGGTPKTNITGKLDNLIG